MMEPHFISLEGGEGVGKSTQLAMLMQALEDRGIKFIATREPGGTEGAEAIRNLLLNGGADRWHQRAEALLFAAARSDHVEKRIKPALAAGQWVICDRFVDSSRAYQANDLISDDDILALHQVGSGMFMPELTVLLDMSTETSARRAAERDGDQPDRIGGRSQAFHESVRQRFRDIASAEPHRFLVVDASSMPQQVHQAIIDHLISLDWLAA